MRTRVGAPQPLCPRTVWNMAPATQTRTLHTHHPHSGQIAPQPPSIPGRASRVPSVFLCLLDMEGPGQAFLGVLPISHPSSDFVLGKVCGVLFSIPSWQKLGQFQAPSCHSQAAGPLLRPSLRRQAPSPGSQTDQVQGRAVPAPKGILLSAQTRKHSHFPDGS